MIVSQAFYGCQHTPKHAIIWRILDLEGENAMLSPIAPTLGCAELLSLGKQVETLDALGVRWYHIDLMDGNFVPNFCLGTNLISALRRATRTKLYVHLMAVLPERHVKLLAECGADSMVFHAETTDAPFRLIAEIHTAGMKAGVAVNPATSLCRIAPYLAALDSVTLMAIEPGIVGPKLMEGTYAKIEALRGMIDACGSTALIEVDGGVSPENGKRCLDCGADVLVAGAHAIFREHGLSLEEQYAEFEKSLKTEGEA
jgi:ribulose-phosphate 3-epimerase